MTSGNFTTYPVESIYVDSNRQRKNITGIDELAWSIKAIGLINPLVIERDGKLVAGERRLRAVKTLGFTDVAVQFTDELPKDQLHLIELEENVRRENLSWQEACMAVEEYHKLRKSLDPTWEVNKTASALRMTAGEVSQKRDIAEQLIKGNDKIITASSLSVARGLVQRNKEREKANVAAKITETITGVKAEDAVKEVPLINADFLEWIKTYSGPPFNFIHCDFPYGVQADKHAQGAAKMFGGYADTFDVYDKLLDGLSSAMEKIIAPSAHLMFWFSMDYYELTRQRLTEMGWAVNPFPVIWFKSDNTGILPDPTRGPRRVYETAFIASRGDRPIVRAVSNVSPCAVSKEIHMSEKPVAMLQHFMKMFVDEHTFMLDPTCGSGNSVKAALAQNAYHVLGIELNKDFFDQAVIAFRT